LRSHRAVYVSEGSGNKTLFASGTGAGSGKPEWLRPGVTFTLQTKTIPPLVLANATVAAAPANYTGQCGAAGSNPYKANATAPVTPCSDK
jgi:hypothetical protein